MDSKVNIAKGIDFNTDNIETDSYIIDYLGELTPEEAEQLINQTIKGVVNTEYELILKLSNGKSLVVKGSQYYGCALGVSLEHE